LHPEHTYKTIFIECDVDTTPLVRKRQVSGDHSEPVCPHLAEPAAPCTEIAGELTVSLRTVRRMPACGQQSNLFEPDGQGLDNP
jgi:hypothetical protein